MPPRFRPLSPALFFICSLFLVWSPNLWAQATVIDLRPEAGEIDDAALPADLSDPPDLQSMQPPDALIEGVATFGDDPQSAICENLVQDLRAEIEAEAFVALPDSPAGLFQALIEQSAAQNSFLYHEEALLSVENALKWLPCSENIVSTQALIQLFMQEAIAHIYLYDGLEKVAFQSILAMDAETTLAEDNTSLVRMAFREAVLRHETSTSMAITALPGGLTLYIDGKKAPQSIQAGYHVLQIQGPDGIIRTRVFPIFEQDGPLDILSLGDFGLLIGAEAQGWIATHLLEDNVDLRLIGLIDNTVDFSGQYQAFYLGDAKTPPQLRLYQISRGLIDDPAAWAAWAQHHQSPPPEKIPENTAPETVEADSNPPEIGPEAFNPSLSPVAGVIYGGFLVDQGTQYLNQGRLGYEAGLRWQLKPRLSLMGSLAYLPHFNRAGLQSTGCGGPNAQPDALAPCQDPKAPLLARLGMAYHLELPGHFGLDGQLAAQFSHLPNTMIIPESGGGWLIGTGIAVGPVAKLALHRQLKLGDLKITPHLGGSLGAQYLFAGPQGHLVIPFSLSGGLLFNL